MSSSIPGKQVQLMYIVFMYIYPYIYVYTHTYIHTLIYIIYGYINIHKDSSNGLQEEMNGRQQQPGDTAWQFMIPPFYFRFEFFPNINFKKCFF